MAEAFDLNIFPIVRQDGQDQTEYPGLYAATPPRRAARGRDRENLVLYLSQPDISQAATARLPAELQTQMLTQLAQTFFKTSGSVTAAMRVLAHSLNRALLEWNRGHTASQAIAYLTQMVIRGEQVFLAHSGPGHAYTLAPEGAQVFADLEDSGRGLGFSRSAALRYFQFQLSEANFILLTHQPEEVWQVDALQVAPNQGMESMRRKLLVGRGDPTLNAILIQPVPGEGKLRFLRLKTSFNDMAQPNPAGEPPEAAVPPQRSPETPEDISASTPTSTAPEESDQAPSRTAVPSPDEAIILPERMPQPAETELPADTEQTAETEFPAQEETPELEQPAAHEEPAGPEELAESGVPWDEAGTDEAPSQAAQQAAEEPAAPETPVPPGPEQAAPQTPPPTTRPQPQGVRQARRSTQSGRTPAARRRPAQQSGPKKPAVAAQLGREASQEMRRVVSAGLKVGGAFQKATASAARQIGGALFAWLRRLLPDEAMLSLSTRTLTFIAIAVPLVVSVIGGMVYIERGQSAQYQQYYDLAVAEASQALEKSDPVEQRVAWQTVLDHLDEAEIYGPTPESQSLRLQAQGSLDQLDGVERLAFQPALLSRLDKDIRIKRMATQGGDLYLLNGIQGVVIRAVLTGGGYQLDTQFVCGPVDSGSAVVGPLVDIVPLPRGESSGATVMGVDASGTLILCIPGEQPLIQPVNPPGINFGEIRAFDLNAGDLYDLDPPQNAVWIYRRRETVNPPRLFFGEEIPHMQNVIDLTVNDDDLYLLHADGHQSLCTYQPDSATRCEDPIEYVDMRPGRSAGPVIPDALFSQLQFAPPPDPSLYMLEPAAHAVYHMSLRLVLQRQYRPSQPLAENPATAFTISANRMLFLAIDHEVFYAALP